MLCPYSHQLCQECSVFRGRHYFLCFCKDYRGYLGEETNVTTPTQKVDVKERESINKKKNLDQLDSS